MAKGTNYGLVTKGDTESRSFGGNTVQNLDTLTRADVYTAIRVLMQRSPNFDKLSVGVAARQVADFLEASGFRGNLTVSGGNISDGSTTVQLTHGKYNGESIITAHEKKR